MATIISDPIYDTESKYWKYTVRFENGNSASEYEHFFETEVECNESIAKAQTNKDIMTPQTVKDFALENKKASKQLEHPL